jgi:hypothetical protein
MSDRARAWLAMRAGAVPPALEARMERAVDDALDDESIPRALAEAAKSCVREALAIGDRREAALHLLAADALITYACAAASDDPVMLRELAAEWQPARLARHLDGRGVR